MGFPSHGIMDLVWGHIPHLGMNSKKKMQHFSKYFTSYLHNGSTLQHNLDRFWKLQFRATTFIFDLFLEFGHVTTLLIDIIIIIFFLFTFGSETTDISFFGHLVWTLNASPNNADHHSYFFLIFSLFYTCFSCRNANVSIFGNAHWTLKTVPSQQHHQSSLFFSDFFSILLPFSIQKSIFSLLGSVHWTLKQYLSITSDDKHPYLFFAFFSLFY